MPGVPFPLGTAGASRVAALALRLPCRLVSVFPACQGWKPLSLTRSLCRWETPQGGPHSPRECFLSVASFSRRRSSQSLSVHF